MRLDLLVVLLGSAASLSRAGSMPDYITGVNLGNWLLSEPWMSEPEWKSMGGEICSDCSSCAMSEFALTQKLGQAKANAAFAQHWSTWFNQSDVDTLVALKINSVRLPLGFWVIESLVDRDTEWYPQGSLLELKRGLRMLREANISVLLDMHAMPGVSALYSMFAGLCTGDAQFYTSYNYDRALQWASLLTALIHLDPDFSTVYGIEAINEPISDPSQTPGLQTYYDNFVRIIRSTELALGWPSCPGVPDLSRALGISRSSVKASATPSGSALSRRAMGNAAGAGSTMASTWLPHAVGSAVPLYSGSGSAYAPMATAAGPSFAVAPATRGLSLQDIVLAQPKLASAINMTNLQLVMAQTLIQAGVDPLSTPANRLFDDTVLTSLSHVKAANTTATLPSTSLRALSPSASGMQRHKRMLGRRGSKSGLNPGTCIVTNFHDLSWQHGNGADGNSSAIGPVSYDQHPYYSFGGVAQPDIESYMQSACTNDRAATAAAAGNAPLVMQEFWVATAFQATKPDMKRFGDAQKLMFRRGRGWYYWSFKVTTPGMVAMDYVQSVNAGLLTKDPTQLFDKNVCAAYQ